MSEEALQIAEKRKKVKVKGEKERYIHLDAESQRIARRDKKAFLSDQCTPFRPWLPHICSPHLSISALQIGLSVPFS